MRYFISVTIQNEIQITFEKEARNHFGEIKYELDDFDQDGLNKNAFIVQGYDRDGFNTEEYKRSKQLVDDEEKVLQLIRINLWKFITQMINTEVLMK